MAKKYYVECLDNDGKENGFVMEVDSMNYYSDESRYKQISKMVYTALREDYCRNALLKIIKPGTTVYTVLRHVSNSGMQRRIDVFVIDENRISCISGFVSGLTHYQLHASKPGLVANGCGMDMGYAIVHALGNALWPTPHGTRNGEPDSSGGYALRHEWL